ncbi:SH3 domain-containing protein [Streptomyces endophytica]|uniref:SH3 domain-containing protein n=1 Tax=Streptomyces endophytica TaxID=2991496 RepID=A0ABY6PET0_9ACTN|nr:SH3 domain-containing protein [Streptomyces endophytica]UZJ32072.1 SH3 domain-containing protein [Streptomyces endophytica]
MNRRQFRSGVVALVAALAMVPAVAVADSGPYRHSGRHAHAVHHGRGVPVVAGRHDGDARGEVVTPPGVPLNVRSGPGVTYRVIDQLRSGSVHGLRCTTTGSRVHGNPYWYRLAHRPGYVSAHYIHAFRTVPWC